MSQQQAQPLSEFAQQFWAFLPKFAAGLLVLLLGVAIGWVVKRTLIRLLMWLRLDRLAGRPGWRAALGKGDVRAALYQFLGNVAFALTVLVFAEDALRRWGLQSFADLLGRVLVYLPNLVVVAVIVAVGVMVANGLGAWVAAALEEEEFAHARLAAKALNGALLAVVGALALWQLQFAREIVLAGFIIAFGACGIAFAIAAGLGSAKAIERGWDALFQRRAQDAEDRDLRGR
jgi:hypothetical protein